MLHIQEPCWSCRAIAAAVLESCHAIELCWSCRAIELCWSCRAIGLLWVWSWSCRAILPAREAHAAVPGLTGQWHTCYFGIGVTLLQGRLFRRSQVLEVLLALLTKYKRRL